MSQCFNGNEAMNDPNRPLAKRSDSFRHQPYEPYAQQQQLQQPMVMELNAPHFVKSEREKKPWVQIETSWISHCHEMPAFPAGFKVNVYDGRLTSYFEVPSEWIVPTHGGMRYVEHFNETGPYSRFRFQLCHNFLNGRCNKGFNCTYIHAKQLPTAHEIHVQGVETYERLPTGLSLFVHMPGSTGRPQMIPSQYIIRTNGSERLYADVIDNKHGTFVRPQHCAHFLFKKLCNRGAECAFIHVLMRSVPGQTGQHGPAC